MIVTEDQVQVALDYMNVDPHPVALARKDLTDAENRAKVAFAKAFLAATGSVDARKATAELDTDYRAARDEEAEAIKEYERHKQHVSGGEMIVSVWQSEGANARAAERVR